MESSLTTSRKPAAWPLLILALALLVGSLQSNVTYAGIKTKAALSVGAVLAGQAIKKCLQPTGCPRKLMDKLSAHLTKHPEHREKLVEIIQGQAIST